MWTRFRFYRGWHVSCFVSPVTSPSGRSHGAALDPSSRESIMHLNRRAMLTAAAAIGVAAIGRRAFAAAELKTVTPGVITIANSGEMPMIGHGGRQARRLRRRDGGRDRQEARPGRGLRADGMVRDRAIGQERPGGHHDRQHGLDAGARQRAADHRRDLLRRRLRLHEKGVSPSPAASPSPTSRAIRSAPSTASPSCPR